MSESLLSFSEVLLFGRPVTDIAYVAGPAENQANAATRDKPADFKGAATIDGVDVDSGDHVLVASDKKDEFATNGLYKIGGGANKNWVLTALPVDAVVKVVDGDENKGYWRQKHKKAGKQKFKRTTKRGLGKNKHLNNQLDEDAGFARIYGFAYEGTYYELSEPTVFLVHGDGDPASAHNKPASRSPLDPSVSGVASADYQVANEIRVWSYDKADYSIRMDVMTGMLEQILLDVSFDADGIGISGAKVSGAKVSGAKVSGAKVSGAKVSGAKVSGAKVSGAKARGD